MATANTTSNTDRADQIHAIAARLAGMESALDLVRENDNCSSQVGDALYLLAASCRQMNDELCVIAGQMTEGGAA